jgi:hypothetical protein
MADRLMIIETQRCRTSPPEGTDMKKVTRIAMLLAVLAAGLATTACQDTNLYSGVDSNGGWNGPSTGSIGGITGYPF